MLRAAGSSCLSSGRGLSKAFLFGLRSWTSSLSVASGPTRSGCFPPRWRGTPSPSAIPNPGGPPPPHDCLPAPPGLWRHAIHLKGTERPSEGDHVEPCTSEAKHRSSVRPHKSSVHRNVIARRAHFTFSLSSIGSCHTSARRSLFTEVSDATVPSTAPRKGKKQKRAEVDDRRKVGDSSKDASTKIIAGGSPTEAHIKKKRNPKTDKKKTTLPDTSPSSENARAPLPCAFTKIIRTKDKLLGDEEVGTYSDDELMDFIVSSSDTSAQLDVRTQTEKDNGTASEGLEGRISSPCNNEGSRAVKRLERELEGSSSTESPSSMFRKKDVTNVEVLPRPPASPHVESNPRSPTFLEYYKNCVQAISSTGPSSGPATPATVKTAVEKGVPESLEPQTRSHRRAYEELFDETYVNPFNGKRLHVGSPMARLLADLGFVRREDNPLFVRWRPEVYVDRLQTVMVKVGEKRARQYEKELKAFEKRTSSRAAARRKKSEERQQGEVKLDGKTKDRRDPMKHEDVVVEPPKPPASPTVAEAIDEILRPFDKKIPAELRKLDPSDVFPNVSEPNRTLDRFLSGSSTSWMYEISTLLRRADALTAVPKRLEELYQDLTMSSVMPPKLDASGSTEPALGSAINKTASGNVADEAPRLEAPSETVLTVDQMNVLHLAEQGFSLFIGGSAGTGKTVLLRQIYKQLTQKGLRVAMTATTGVAAVQLGGCTFHHAFNAPVLLNGGSVLAAELWGRRWDQTALRSVDTVMVDEVSLLDAQTFDAFDMEARLARMSVAPFGGIQVIICGDFMQLSIGLQDALPAYLAVAFQFLMKVRLETPMRHRANDPLLPLLTKVRRGEFDAEAFKLLDKPVPMDEETNITFIFPRRRDAQQLNELKLSALVTQEMHFAPHRGPLRLSGVFTSSALFEVSHGASTPQRSRLLDVLREELLRLLQDTSAVNIFSLSLSLRRYVLAEGKALLNRCITDVDLVMMPAQTSNATSLSDSTFFIRLRYPDRSTALHGGTPLSSSAPDSAASSPSPAVSSDSPCGDATPVSLSSTSSAAGHPRSPAALLHSLLTNELWEALAAAVATRLECRLVTFFTEEPRSLIPLSVTMALADMTNHDIAQTLSPLRLKLGCRVMVTRNLSRRVSNGSVGTVEAFADPDPKLFPSSNTNQFSRLGSSGGSYVKTLEAECFKKLPIVRLLDGSVVQIPPIPLHIGGTPLTYYYGHDVYAVPLQLGYAFTVHKVQGLTLQGKVVLDCKHFFECPHLIYVACSRVTNMDQLIVKHIKPEMVMVKQNALEFSDSLMPASGALGLVPPEDIARGAWVLAAGSCLNAGMVPSISAGSLPTAAPGAGNSLL